MTDSDGHLERVRRMCLALPGSSEKMSHGEPTFFVKKRVFAMIANNHHNDGHVAVWIPAAPGEQAELVKRSPATYYVPPYCGVNGWVGIALYQISDDDLGAHLTEAWRMISSKRR